MSPRPVLTPLTLPALLGFAFLAMAPGKCVPAPLPEEPLCDSAKDCEGQAHPDCAGAWTCTDDATCAWECQVAPPTCDGGCASGETCQCSEICDSSGACKATCGCVPVEPGPMCWADSDCKAGETCVCDSACGGGGGGPVPPVPCLMNCTCQPAPCAADVDCGDGCTCMGGACVCEPPPPVMCWADSDCDAGCFCDMSASLCIVAPCFGQCSCGKPTLGECASDGDCGAGASCTAGSKDCLPCASCPSCAMCCGMCEADPAPSTCAPTGCSGQICASEPMFTTCEWNPVYACYSLAKCGNTGPDGACAWSGGADFDACLGTGGLAP